MRKTVLKVSGKIHHKIHNKIHHKIHPKFTTKFTTKFTQNSPKIDHKIFTPFPSASTLKRQMLDPIRELALARSLVNWSSVNFPKRELLSLRSVLAFPKASRIGLEARICLSTVV